MKGIDGFGDNLIMAHQHGAKGTTAVAMLWFASVRARWR
jgi:hypothetical protein